MPPEQLTNAETLSNIYSKRTILKEFSGEHAPILLTSAQHYHNYIRGSTQKFPKGRASPKNAPHKDKKDPPHGEKVAKKSPHDEKGGNR